MEETFGISSFPLAWPSPDRLRRRLEPAVLGALLNPALPLPLRPTVKNPFAGVKSCI